MRHTSAMENSQDAGDPPGNWKSEIQALLLLMMSGAPAPVPGEFLSHQAMVTKGSVYLSWESCCRQDPYAGEEGGGLVLQVRSLDVGTEGWHS